VDQKLELLRRVPLFAGLGRRDLAEVGRLADQIDLPAGRVLTREGRSADEFFLIVDGSVRIERGGRTVNRLGSGDFLGEIALIDGGPRTATTTVEEGGRFLVVGHREFHSLLEQFPKIQLAVLEAMAHRVRDLDPDSCT
jgi:CRP/FNR family transcriptional regulator, cyclic AMP receptor protein